MLLPLSSLDQGALLRLIRDQYEIQGHDLVFQPLGEDSWAYQYGPLWISIRRDLRGHVPAAYATSAALAEQGLDFVLAPLAGVDGKYTHQIGPLPVVVFPLCFSSSLEREDLSTTDLAMMKEMIEEVHAGIPVEGLPTEDYRLAFDMDLTVALARAEDNTAPPAGLYDLPLRQALRDNRGFLADLRAEAGVLGDRCTRSGIPMVLTHGEPSLPNWVYARGSIVLVDWGGAAWGPPARDWFHMCRTMQFPAETADYFQRFYEIRWSLSEIAEYATIFAHPHVGNREDQAMWSRLARYLPHLPSVGVLTRAGGDA
jgi:spectinomycin phosphotransferase